MAMISCPNCAKTLGIPDSAAGKKVRCQGCQCVFGSPQPAVHESAEEVPVTVVAELPTPKSATKPATPQRKPANTTGSSKARIGGASVLLAIGGIVIGGGLLFSLVACAGGGLWFILALDHRAPEPQQAAIRHHDKGPQDDARIPNRKPPEDKKPDDRKPKEEKPEDKKPIIETIQRGNLRAIPLQANDLVFDARRGHVYAAIANNSPKQANTVTALDPTSGAALWSVGVGSNPSTLALSDDGHALWVGFRGASGIQRIDIVNRQAGPLFPLDNNRFGPSFAEKVLAVPGKNDAVIVNLVRQGTTSRGIGLVVCDNGVARPMDWKGSGAGAVTLTDDPKILFTYNNESTEFGLRRIELDDAGVRQTIVYEAVIRGFSAEITHWNGRIYTSVGAVVDARTGVLAGTIPAEGSFCVDGERKRAYYLVVKKNTLEAYDTDSLTKQAYFTDGVIDKSAGALIRIGAAGLAFRTKGEIILVPDKELRPSGAAAPEAKATPDNIPLKANALAFDARRGHLYAAVSASPRRGNTICAIDPKTGATVWVVNVASDPGSISLSDDGKALWVGFTGSSCLQRVDLDKRQVGPALPLPAGAHGTRFVQSLQVLPGTTDTVVASLYVKGVSPGHQGVFVFDNGVCRPKQAPGHIGSNRIITTEDPAELFGLNTETTNYGLRRLKVDPAGIHEGEVVSGAVPDSKADIAYANGRIFSTLGTVFDAKTLGKAVKLPAKGPIAVDPGNKLLHILAAGKIETFDTMTLKRRSTNACAPLSPPTDASRAVALGADAIAYTTSQNIVVVPLTNRP